MKRLLAAASILALLAGPAHSAWGQWDNIGHWGIQGESQKGACMATAPYQNGQTLSVVFDKRGSHLFITGITAQPLTPYDVVVHTSTGSNGVWSGVSNGDGDSIFFWNLHKSALRELVRAQAIAIRGVGKFDLTGSKRAMASAWECFETLNSI